MLRTVGSGMQPNPSFVDDVEEALPDKDAAIVLVNPNAPMLYCVPCLRTAVLMQDPHRPSNARPMTMCASSTSSPDFRCSCLDPLEAFIISP